VIGCCQRVNLVFVQLCFNNGKFINRFFDGATALTDSCRKSVPGNVVHAKVTKVAVQFLKARVISALDLLIHKSGHEAEYIVAIDANKIGIVGILLLQGSSISLRS